MSPESVIAATAERHGVEVADIRSRRRAAVPAKKEAARALRDMGLSWPQIGRAMNCHHTSAIWRAKN